MSRVIPERDRCPVRCTDTALGAKDQVLVAENASGIESHADALGESKQVTARPSPQDLVA